MDWWLASFFLGALLSLFLPIVPDFFVLFLLLLLSIIFFYYKPCRPSSGLLFGVFWMLFSACLWQSNWQDNVVHLHTLETKPQKLQGQVLSLQLLDITSGSDKAGDERHSQSQTEKPQQESRLRFNLQVSHINSKKLQQPLTVRLSWKNPSLKIQQGQVIQVLAKLKPAHGLGNLGGFSYQTWLNSHAIAATGYVIKHQLNTLITKQRSTRQYFFNGYAKLLPEHQLAPLLLALGFGSRAQLTLAEHEPLWQVLQHTGTSHLIAISGLHIGLVATASYFMVMLVIRLIPLFMLSRYNGIQGINSRYLAIFISMLVALLYAYLAGFSLPTLRALLMLSLYWCFRLVAIKISIKRWLLLTLFIMLLIAPFSLLSASFWLSFYAVSIIFLSLWRFKTLINTGKPFWCFIKGLVVIQLCLTLMLWPISAIFFQQISLLALVANIVAVPWMSFISIPLCLLSVLCSTILPSLASALITLCLTSLQYLWQYLTFLAEQPWAILQLNSQHSQLFFGFGIGLLYLLFLFPRLLFTGQSRKAMGLASLFVLSIALGQVLNAYYQPRHVNDYVGKNTGKDSDTATEQHLMLNHRRTEIQHEINWQLVVFDVGQGLSVLLQKDQHAILYDTGAAYESGFTMVEAVVLPYLQHQGINSLDKVIISHNDNDHAGGLTRLEDAIAITELIFNRDNTLLGNSVGTQQTCQQGKSFQWYELHITMLWPKEDKSKENDDSCVLLISDNQHKVLLTGDISQQVEAQLINQYPQLRADILLAPHHGSKTSSSNAFISQLNPLYAIFSSGYLNRWHMPVAEVVGRYQALQINLLNSAESGQIRFNFSSQGINVQTYHDDFWPFWFANNFLVEKPRH